MKIILTLLASFLSFLIYAQIQVNQTEFDLGEISLLNSDIVDFNVQNISSEEAYLLRIEAEKQVGFQYTTKNFKPGAKEGIRIKLNPNKRGKIEQTIKLYFSSNSEPIEIKLKAIVKALPKNNRTACPTFGSSLKPPTGTRQPIATIQALDLLLFDEESKQALATGTVEQIDNEDIQESTAANSSNQIDDSLPIRTRVPRTPKQKTPWLTPKERRNSPSLGTILFGKTSDTDTLNIMGTEEGDEVVEEEVSESENVEIEDDDQKVELKTDKISNNLLDDSFKPNNIVFLIDASTSMREEQKMEILKKAMIELLEPLREIDYITIVTYSGEASVIVPTSKGNLKDEIAEKIENLKADGSTNAVKGIKKAIQVGNNNFLEDGNNQIFLASDGAFNIGERNMSLRKKIKKTAEAGLTITVLGIKNDNWTNKSLKEIAALGEGDLIKIKYMKDASKVLKSMKRWSLR